MSRLAMRTCLRYQQGLSLIELMISLILGSLITLSVTGVILAGKSSFSTQTNLATIQENALLVSQLLGQDIRAASFNGCGSQRTLNILNNSGSDWWSEWDESLKGYSASEDVADIDFGTSAQERVSGSQALQVIYADNNETYLTGQNSGSATLSLASTSGFSSGDIAMICDPEQATIFQVTSVASSTVGYAKSGSPGNCAALMGYVSSGCPTTARVYGEGAYVTRLGAVVWYLGYNGRTSGTSLYRMVQDNGSSQTVQEMVEGVSSLAFTYMVSGSTSYVSAGSVTDWSTVVAVKTTLGLASTDTNVSTSTSTDSGRLQRTLTFVTALRNR
ncbi:PilW family protein [Pokkaliibacter sp. MBI-7]|uniref:PilW family protein n=1 Tax=Pokkaliibacter sp. MBI-7 TaxID=3040600 RepID=UPI00244D3D68|nr:PilW family protein [Pokkaliibacter sp. MBI-7]MDH2433242.1 PilW family protein [Pokkaliibacter sp. MBI-7]